MFTLKTAVPLFVYIDVLMFLFVLSTDSELDDAFNMYHIMTGKRFRRGASEQGGDRGRQSGRKVSFQTKFVTEYLFMFVLIMKVIRALQFLNSSLIVPKNDEYLLDALGD